MNKNQSLLRQYLWPVRGRITVLLLLLFVNIGLQVYTPQLMRQFLDEAQAGVVMSVLVGTAVLFFLATVIQKIIFLVSVYVSQDLGWQATNTLRLDLTDHILRLDMGFHKLQPAGELIERIDGDISNLAEYFSDLIVGVFANVVLAVAILFFLFREDWRVGLIGLAYGLCILLVLRFIQNIVVGYWKAVRVAFTNLFGFVEERLGGLEDVRANGGTAHVLYRLATLNQATYQARVKAETFSQGSFMTGYFLYALALAGSIWIGVLQYRQGQMTAGSIVLLITYIGLLETPFDAIRREAETLQRALASISRVQELFGLEVKVVGGNTAVFPQTPPMVQFDGVSFGYKDRDSVFSEQYSVFSEQYSVDSEQDTASNDQSPISQSPITQSPTSQSPNYQLPITNYPPPPLVLNNITFTLNSGKILGVLGRTGSGKTTLTRLLFRLYDVDSGGILFNGIDIRQVELSDLRHYVGLVTQDVQLFEATIRDNLTLFRNYDPQKAPISDAQIIEALTTLGLDGWLNGLEDGLNTRLKAGGKGLSAGEAQLVALTRVFLRDPKLVILDEASSRLDPATEQLLERAIDALLQNRTGIIIAHRLSTVMRADDILILENGRIREHGERTSLMADLDSRFSALLRPEGLMEDGVKR